MYARKQVELIIIFASIFQLGFVLGKAYYRKEHYTDLELPVAVNRIKEMLTKVSGSGNNATQQLALVIALT